MIDSLEKMKTVLRFDVGASGFMKMIYTLIVMSVILLVLGAYFMWDMFLRVQ